MIYFMKKSIYIAINALSLTNYLSTFQRFVKVIGSVLQVRLHYIN